MSRVMHYAAYTGTIEPGSALPDGDYLEVVRLPGKEITSNGSCWKLWRQINEAAQRIGASPSAGQPEMTKDLIESVLKNIDRCFVMGSSLAVTRANSTFSDVYGGPSNYLFEPWAIPWTGSNAEALRLILRFVSAAFQATNVPSNRLDNGIIDDHLWTILKPLYDAKASVMKAWFGIEVQGEVSPDELDAMFRGSNLRPPMMTSYNDRRDSVSTLTAEDKLAMTNESAAVPTTESIEQAMAGIDVWTWVPTQANWATFGELLRRLEEAGPSQPPRAEFPFSTTIGAPSISGAASGGGGGTGTVTPT